MGFTSSLGIDFPGETSAVLMPINSVTAPDLARMGFGQTIAITALQMTAGFNAVINGGNMLQPYLLKTISTETGKQVYNR